ncbi:transposase [Zhongshania sp.]|uniref:transposase n=1 Tax=Zhongshania sp. TaxID=1971902 RepID=UPI0035682562
MNQRRKFTEDFKQEAAAQVIERGYPIKEVANHLGISDKTLYNWVNRFRVPSNERDTQDDLTAENRRLLAELRRMTEERDILKKATAYFARESE